jgi:5-methylcytosine-specific restriction endonuclease McrA
MRGEQDGETAPLVCKCTVCSRVYPYDYRRGHTKLICNSCRSNRRVDRGALKRRMVEYKGGSCVVCGYSTLLRALTFHHVHPEAKAFNIAGAHNRSWQTLQAELDQTVLLCIRCHMEVEAGFRDLPRNVKREATTAAARMPRTLRRRPGRPASA